MELDALNPEMELKKLHMGTIVFGWEAMDEVSHLLAQTFGDGDSPGVYSVREEARLTSSVE